jgi:hypothetical protein
MWGSSLDYSLQKMLDVIDDFNVNGVATLDVNAIFLLTYEIRFNLKFLDPGHQFLPKYVYAEEIPDQFKDRYTDHYEFIKQFFEYYVDDFYQHRSDYLKIVGMLKLYSQIFKKILVIPCFSVPHIKLKNWQDISISFVNDDRFQLVDGSFMDCHGPSNLNSMDPLPNHLFEHTHIAIYNQLTDWIDTNKYFDASILSHGGTR